MPRLYIIVGKNGKKFIAFFAGEVRNHCEGDTKAEAIFNLLTTYGRSKSVLIEDE
jgi:hypothetical protein